MSSEDIKSSYWVDQVWRNKIARYVGKYGEQPSKEEIIRVANKWIGELQCLKVSEVMKELGEDDE